MQTQMLTQTAEFFKDDYSSYNKYLIFLPNRLCSDEVVNIGCGCGKSKKKAVKEFNKKICLVETLSDKGITVKFTRDIKQYVGKRGYSFDDGLSPKLNTLYIHLFDGDYYSDDLYARKKSEREREILFLLAIKLGVKSIFYETKIVETTVTRVGASVNIDQYGGISGKYSKTSTETEGQTGTETYINRGAPIYVLSDNLEQVEENIRQRFGKLNSKTFSFDFYRDNDKLRLFVYKRFNFKIEHYEYTTSVEDNMEISFDVKTQLMNFGLGMQFDKQIIVAEKVTYKMDFFSDKDLRLCLSNNVRINEDSFSAIREVYDNEADKDIAIYHITEYVRKYSKSCYLIYTLPIPPQERANKNKKREITDNYRKRLEGWIKDKGIEKFKNECHNFTSSYQIRTWFKRELILPNENIIENDDDENDSDIENYGLLKLKKANYKKYRDNILQTGNYCSLQESGRRRNQTRTMKMKDRKMVIPISDSKTDEDSDYNENYSHDNY